VFFIFDGGLGEPIGAAFWGCIIGVYLILCMEENALCAFSTH